MDRLVLGSVLAAVVGGCSARAVAPPPEPAAVEPVVAAAPPTPEASASSRPAPPSPPRCTLGASTRVDLTQASTGLVRRRAARGLSVARSAARTLVVLRVEGDSGCDHDGCSEAVPLAFEVRPGVAATLEPLESSAIGISPGVDVAALPTPAGPRALTQGHRGAAPPPGSPEPERLFLSAVGAGPLARARGPSSGELHAAWAARGPLVAIAGWEPRPGGLGPPSVRVMPLPLDQASPKLRSHVLAWGVELRHRFEAPRLAAAGDRAAALFVRHQSAGDACDEGGRCVPLQAKDSLQGIWLDPTSAAPRGRAQDLWVGPVEEPTGAMVPGALALAWSTSGELRGALWSEGEAPRHVALSLTGRSVALASLAGGHLALASAGPGGVEVRVGAGLEAAARAPAEQATGAGGVREVRLALDDRGEGHVVWVEAAAVVARSLVCR